MSVNPHRGEVAVVLDGQHHRARLTLGALAALEAALGAGSLVEVIERFEAGRFSSRDVMAVLVAGLHQHATNLCVEVGRQAAPGHIRPSFIDLENRLRELKRAA